MGYLAFTLPQRKISGILRHLATVIDGEATVAIWLHKINVQSTNSYIAATERYIDELEEALGSKGRPGARKRLSGTGVPDEKGTTVRMIFNASEVCAIAKQHVIKTWGIPETAIKDVKLFAPSQGRAYIEVTIETDAGGGPYRTAAYPDFR